MKSSGEKGSFHRHHHPDLKPGMGETKKKHIERVWIIACLIDSFFSAPVVVRGTSPATSP